MTDFFTLQDIPYACKTFYLECSCEARTFPQQKQQRSHYALLT